jgi:hypothetical protein
MKILISESLVQVKTVIKESAHNSEKLVELKERMMKHNAREQDRFNQMRVKDQVVVRMA